MRHPEILERLHAEGLTVVETNGWRGRGSTTFAPGCSVNHHTAGARTGDAPSLGIVVDGRAGIPPPLANVLQSRHADAHGLDVVYLIAAGRANHAGVGHWQQITGNSHAWGLEVEHVGTGAEPFPPARMETSVRVHTAFARCSSFAADRVCFPAGVLILTRAGFVPIEAVDVGTEVWTHRGRWRPVTATGSRWARTIRLRGRGHPSFVTTPDHPLLSPDMTRGRIEGRAGHNGRRWGDTRWLPAEQMAGRHWCSPSKFTEDGEPVLTPEQAWVVGHWLAEGWITGGRLQHACHPREADEVLGRVRAAGWIATASPKESTTVVNVRVGRPFSEWLVDNFGKGATGKRIPGWVYEQPDKQRAELLAGYLYGDGWVAPDGHHEASSVSKALALGVKLLAQSLGWMTSLHFVAARPGHIIRGRVVTQRDSWKVQLRPFASSRARGWFIDDYFVAAVRSVEASVDREVFNLTVADDESYVADGIVVHNCQHWEWATPPGRKTDFTRMHVDAGQFRSAVARRLAGTTAAASKPTVALPSAVIVPGSMEAAVRITVPVTVAGHRGYADLTKGYAQLPATIRAVDVLAVTFAGDNPGDGWGAKPTAPAELVDVAGVARIVVAGHEVDHGVVNVYVTVAD